MNIRATRLIGATLLLLLAGLVLQSTLTPAQQIKAAPLFAGSTANPFLCDGTIYISRGDSASTTTFSVNTGTDPYTLDAITPTTSYQYNSIGFNVQDGLMYALVRSNDAPDFAINDFISIDAVGNVINYGQSDVSPEGAYAGDVDENGIFYLTKSKKLFAYDTKSADFPNSMVGYPKTISRGLGADISYNPADGYLYGATGQKLLQTDPNTGTITQITMTPVAGTDTYTGAFGATWFDADGFFWGYRNNTGIYKIDLAAKTYEFVSEATSVSTNDGTSCAYAPILRKTVSPSPVSPGSTITYTFEIVNGFQQTPMAFGLEDTLPPSYTFVDGTLTISNAQQDGTPNAYGDTDTIDINGMEVAAGETTVVTVDVFVDYDVTSGTYKNQATLTDLLDSVGGELPSDYPVDAEVGDPTPHEVESIVELNLDKGLSDNADEDGSDDVSVGDTLTYKFVVTNDGNVRMRDVEITDPMLNLSALDCSPAQPLDLLPTESSTCTATYTVTQADMNNGRIDNTATATGKDPSDNIITDADTVSLPLSQTSSISLDKTISKNADEDGSDDISLNDTLTYAFEVVNEGNTTLTNVSIVDPHEGLSAIDCVPVAPATLQPNDTMSCTATYAVDADDVLDGNIRNKATVTGQDPAGNDISDSDQVNTASAQNPAIELNKDMIENADGDGSGNVTVGDVLTYQFVATNDGDVPLVNVSIDDPLAGLSALDCSPAQPASLAVGASLSCKAAYEVTQTDVDNGSIQNKASVRGVSPEKIIVTDDAVKSVPIAQESAVNLKKGFADNADEDNSGDISLDDTLTYKFVVLNEGNVTLSNIIIEESMSGVSALNCSPAMPSTLAPAATMTCTATYSVTQNDVDAGEIINKARVKAEDPNNVVISDIDSDRVATAQDPNINLDKTLKSNDDEDSSDSVTIGDTLTYQFFIENTGDVSLTNVGVTDALAGVSTPDCTPAAPATLAPAETMTCTATYVVVQDNIDAGVVINRAEATGEAPDGEVVDNIDVLGVDTEFSANVALTKSLQQNADEDGSDDISLDDTLTYEFVATNSGSTTINSVEISDPLPNLSALSCSPAAPATLMPNEAMTCTATYVVTQDDVDNGEIPNTATVSALDAFDEGMEETADLTLFPPQAPAISLDKSFSNNADEDASDNLTIGDTMTYTFDITNSGNVTLSNIDISDPMVGLSPISCTPVAPATLAPAATMSCSATYQVVQADIDNGTIDNTATIIAKDPNGGDVSTTDVESVGVDQIPAIELDKEVDLTSFVKDDVLTYTFNVENTGNVSLTDVTVTDLLPNLSQITCVPAQGATLAPNETMTCSATYTADQDDVDYGDVENNATVTANDQEGNPVSDNDAETVTSTQIPALELEKAMTDNADEDGSGTVSLDDTITYTFDVENTGTVSMTLVDVVDEMVGLSELSCAPAMPATLASGEDMTCTATYKVTQDDVDAGTIENKAVASGTDHQDVVHTDDGLETVPVPQTPAIALDKSLQANADEDGSSTVSVNDTLTYAFLVSNTGNTTLTDVDVSDPLPNLGDIACAPATPATLAPNESMNCTAEYVVDQDDADAGTIHNEATASAKDPNGETIAQPDTVDTPVPQFPNIALDKSLGSYEDADGSGTMSTGDTITYAFVVENTGNVTLDNVVVSDAMPNLSALSCAPATPATIVPTETVECTAAYLLTEADMYGGTLFNEASVSATDPSDDPVTDGSDEIIPFTASPALQIEKALIDNDDADGSSSISLGDTLTYQFDVTNTGNVVVYNTKVLDRLDGVSELDCSPVTPTDLAPNATITCTATYEVSQADVDAGQIKNKGVANGDDLDNNPVSDNDVVITDIDQTAAIEIVKTVENDDVDGSDSVTMGDVLTYSFAIENTGNVTLDDVQVVDVMDGLSAMSCSPAQGATVLPEETMSCTATLTVSESDVEGGAIINQATASGDDPDGTMIDDTDSVTVEVEKDPVVPVTLASVSSRQSGSSVTVDWTTEMEAGVVGYVLHGVNGNGIAEPLHSDIIISDETTTFEPQSYTRTVSNVSGTFYIQSIDLDGTTDLHGPFQVGTDAGVEAEVDLIDWDAIKQENDALETGRLNEQRQSQSRSAVAAEGDVLRMIVAQDGIYRVTHADLVTQGVNFVGMKATDITLVSQDQSIPIYISGSGTFSNSDYIEFYGEAVDSLYTDENVYTLSIGKASSAQMSVDNGTVSAAPEAFYMATALIDENKRYDFVSPAVDPWYYDIIRAVNGSTTTPFSVTVDNLVDGAEARLQVNMWGNSGMPTQSPDHHVVAMMGGSQLANVFFDGHEAAQIDAAIPDGVLVNGENSFDLMLPHDLGASWDYVSVDSFGISYPRAFVAMDDQLVFSSAGSAFSVSGFSSDSVVAYRLKYGVPTRLAVSVSGGSVSLAGSGEDADYIVATTGSLLTPSFVPVRQSADILSDSADYLMIAHPNFISGLIPLVNHHTDAGLSVRVVNVFDIYETYNHGIVDAHAIHTYIKDAYATMDTKYVLFVGGDNYYYHNNAYWGGFSFVPSLYAKTGKTMNHAPVDPMFGDVDGDSLPDVAIGRFPVRTTNELAAIVNKTLAFANSLADAPQTSVTVSDIYDESTELDFRPVNALIKSSLPSSWTATQIELDNVSGTDARQQLIDAINDGTRLVNYTGHSATRRWSFEAFFAQDDVATLNNGTSTIFTQYGCWSNYYVHPTHNTMGHTLTLADDKGGVASLGSAGIVAADSSAYLSGYLTDELTKSEATLGDAINAAKRSAAAHHVGDDVLLGFTLLGDPALKVSESVDATDDTDSTDDADSTDGTDDIDGTDDVDDTDVLDPGGATGSFKVFIPIVTE